MVTEALFRFGDAAWDIEGLLYLLNENRSIHPYIKSIKISPICPLPVQNLAGKYTINNGIVNLVGSIYGLNWGGSIGGTPTRITILTRHSDKPAFCDVDLSNTFKTTFAIDEVMHGTDAKFNPKMLSPACSEFSLVDYAGNRFAYDIQKLSANKVRVLATELVSPDLTKGYVRFKDTPNSAYDNGSQEDYTGLVYSNDTSIPFSVSALDSFLANNKNFALMQQAGRDYEREVHGINEKFAITKGAFNIAAGVATGGGSAQSIANGLGSAANLYIDTVQGRQLLSASQNQSKLMESLTLDNMRSAPSSLMNAQGNALFSALVSSHPYLALYSERHSALDADKRKMLDYFNMFGFSFQQIGNVRDWHNTREFYNFVQANIDNIVGNIGNEIRADLKRRFAEGVRFWASDNIDYTIENYEKNLIS
jgi:hypothetical protein